MGEAKRRGQTKWATNHRVEAANDTPPPMTFRVRADGTIEVRCLPGYVEAAGTVVAGLVDKVERADRWIHISFLDRCLSVNLGRKPEFIVNDWVARWECSYIPGMSGKRMTWAHFFAEEPCIGFLVAVLSAADPRPLLHHKGITTIFDLTEEEAAACRRGDFRMTEIA